MKLVLIKPLPRCLYETIYCVIETNTRKCRQWTAPIHFLLELYTIHTSANSILTWCHFISFQFLKESGVLCDEQVRCRRTTSVTSQKNVYLLYYTLLYITTAMYYICQWPSPFLNEWWPYDTRWWIPGRVSFQVEVFPQLDGIVH